MNLRDRLRKLRDTLAAGDGSEISNVVIASQLEGENGVGQALVNVALNAEIAVQEDATFGDLQAVAWALVALKAALLANEENAE